MRYRKPTPAELLRRREALKLSEQTFELRAMHERIRERDADRMAYAKKILGTIESKPNLKLKNRNLHKDAWGYFNILTFAYGAQCLDCGASSNLVIDHVIPLYRQGTNSIENLQILCLACNFKKGLKIIDFRPGPFPEELCRYIF